MIRYNYLIDFVGGVIKTAVLDPPANVHTRRVSADEWTLDLEGLEKLVTPKTKMFVSQFSSYKYTVVSNS